jgi:hypothetical protein
MKAYRIPILTLLLCSSAPGCTQRECTLIGCVGGIGVDLQGFAVTHSGDLPLTLTACVGSVCDAVRIDPTGEAPVCTVETPGVGALRCTIDGQGTVVLTELAVPDGTADGAMLPVHVTATNEQGTVVVDATEPVTISSFQPNGPGCDPGCLEGQLNLTL